MKLMPVLRRMVLLLLAAGQWAGAQSEDPATGRDAWEACFSRPAVWYGSEEAARVAENVLLYQRDSGGWPKNIELVGTIGAEERARIRSARGQIGATIDNNATHSEIRFLLRAAVRTGEKRFLQSAERGLEYLLRAQYPNGGWPQFYPPMKGYYTHITFNDDAMAGVLNLFFDIVHGRPESTAVSCELKDRLRSSMERGISCILRCQVRINGMPAAWCAQHDENTFAPAKARAYELPSLSGKETVGIVAFLMRLNDPSREVVAAIQGAVRWLDHSRVRGIRIVEEPDAAAPHGMNKVVIPDSAAPSIWGRFYDLETNEVFFCDRDGVKRSNLAELSSERRNHYGWFGYWPQELLERAYPVWQNHWAPGENVLHDRSGK